MGLTQSTAAQAVWRDLFAGAGVTLVRADYPSGYVHPPHADPYASVTLLLSGGVEESVGRRTETGGPLSVVLKEAGVVHACMWGRQGTRTLSVEIEPALMTELESPRRGVPWLWQRGGLTPNVLVSFVRAHEAGQLPSAAPDLILELLASIAGPDAEEGHSPPPWMRRSVEAIRESSPRRPSTHALAKDAGVHPVHFARAFRRHVGLTPTGYARWLRLEAAAHALVMDNAEVGRIALRCGFADHPHLCREINSALCTTPSRLRALGTPVCLEDSDH